MEYDFKKTTTKIIQGGSDLFKDAREQLGDVFGDFEDVAGKLTEKLKPYKIINGKTETIIEFNFAGFSKEEIKVQIDERKGTLKLTATRVAGETTETLSRTFRLANGVTAAAIKSVYRHGLLVVTIQKPNVPGSQDIPID